MISFSKTKDGKFVKIWDKGEKENISYFPSASFVYIESTHITVIRNSIHADNEITIKLDDIDYENSVPSFSKANLSEGLANFFVVKENDSGASSGGGGDISDDDILKFKAWMESTFGAQATAIYQQLVADNIIKGINILNS